MEQALKDKITLLADKTRAQFNMYASLSQHAPDDVKANSLTLIGLYTDLVDTLKIPDDVAQLQEEGMQFMADLCKQSGDEETAAKLIECAEITREVLEEMDMPENTCPSPNLVETATAAVLARRAGPTPS